MPESDEAVFLLVAHRLKKKQSSSTSRSSKAWLPPLRYSLPVIILVFGMVLTSAQTGMFLALYENGAVNTVIERANRHGPRLSRMTESFSDLNYTQALNEELLTLRAEQGVHLAVIRDASGRPSPMETTDQTPLGALEEERMGDEIMTMLANTVLSGTWQVRVHSSRSAVLAVFPVGKSGATPPNHFIVIGFDLLEPLAAARKTAWTQALIAAAMVALGSLVIWAALDATVAKRASRIAAEAGAMAVGDMQGPPLEGDDELAQIDRALREANRRIIAQADDLRTREALLEERNQERNRMQSEIIQISEREKRRIGQDIHDDLCQRLAAIKMKVQDHEEVLAGTAPSLIDNAEAIANDVADAIRISRALARGLSPVDIESGGIATALDALARSTNDILGIDCRFETDDRTTVVSTYIANQLYRIAQECITNAVKHAHAQHITVSLKSGPEKLMLRVANDGLPMPPSDGTGHGMGMHIMRYRAESIGSTLTFESGPADSATAVRCELSLQAASKHTTLIR